MRASLRSPALQCACYPHPYWFALSPLSGEYGQRSLKSILTWAAVYTRVHRRTCERVYPRTSCCLWPPHFYATVTCAGCASSNLRLLGAPLLIRSTSTGSFLFRALLKTVERCLKIRRALYRLILHTHTHTHTHTYILLLVYLLLVEF